LKNKKSSFREDPNERDYIRREPSINNVPPSDAEDREKDRLLQELQVHQFELEMQNDELRRANEELEMQRIRFLGIYELAPIGYFVLDAAGIIGEVNSTGLELLDIDKTLVVGRSFLYFVEQSARDEFHRFFKRTLKSHEKQSCQLQFVSRFGKTFFAQVEGIAIEGLTPHSTTCYMALIDITERKEALEKLEETKERLELALEASDAGTWEYNYETGRFLLNESIYQILSLQKGIYTGEYQSFLDVVAADSRSQVDEHLRNCINRYEEVNIEFPVIRPSGKSWVSMKGHLFKYPDGSKRYLGTIIDISDKKSLERETQRLKVQQQRKITTAILDTEVKERRRISESLHDGVCQLLYGIKLNIQQMNFLNLEENTPLSKMSHLVDLAIRETRNIAFELAPSILNDFGLSITIDELCKRLSTPHLTIRSQVKGLDKRLGLSLETSIFRIVQELVNNAIKHAGATEILVNVRKGATLEISVTDNGCGFDTNALDSNTSGSGLRNVTSKIKLFEGEVDMNSKKGKGTSVRIILKKLTA